MHIIEPSPQTLTLEWTRAPSGQRVRAARRLWWCVAPPPGSPPPAGRSPQPHPSGGAGASPHQLLLSPGAPSLPPFIKMFRFNFGTTSSSSATKKVPMNRVVVGTAPSPNLAISQSRVDSLANAGHRPGGGQVGTPDTLHLTPDT